MRLAVREVDEIPLTSAGKLRVVVNQCSRSAEPALTADH